MWRGLRRAAAIGLLRLSSGLRRRTPYGVLTLSLSGALAEEVGDSRLAGLLRRPAADYLELLTLLRQAREDPRLAGVLLRVDDLQASWARLQGLRRAVEKLRAAGKRVWVHLERAGVSEYYLASAAERVLLTPAATLEVTGLSSEALFLRQALERVGVEAEVIQVGRYKSAGEMFSRSDMSPAHREMLEALVDDLYAQVGEAVAAGRGLDAAAARDLLGRGPFTAAEALQAQLVDATAYADEAEQQLVDACAAGPLIERPAYARQRGRETRLLALQRARHTVALLHVGGTIRPGESTTRPDGATASGAASVAAALKDVRERDDIAALVVRVASPGGSALASDLMWRELERTRAVKPVVASCGDVAASGGYYIAMVGRPLLAEAGTITGSIGVVAGKATLRGLYDRLGVHKELVGRGRHASLLSDYHRLDDEGRARLQAQADAFYRDFVAKVAAARGLAPEAAEASAQGRVWTGRQAQARGLVDELGGLEEAFDAVRRALGLAADQPLLVERVPRPKRWQLPRLNLGLPGSVFLRERIWAVLPFRIRFF